MVENHVDLFDQIQIIKSLDAIKVKHDMFPN